MLKGLTGAQGRKEWAKKRKSLDQTRHNRIIYFETITALTISERIVLYFFVCLFPAMFGMWTKLQMRARLFCEKGSGALLQYSTEETITFHLPWHLCSQSSVLVGTQPHSNVRASWTAEVQEHAFFRSSFLVLLQKLSRADSYEYSGVLKPDSIRIWKVWVQRSRWCYWQHRLSQ